MGRQVLSEGLGACARGLVKLLSWNILQGGGRRSRDILGTIENHSPEIVCLQEFRRGSSAQSIQNGLKALGLNYIHVPETAEPREHTLLVASKYGFDAGPFLTKPNRPLHLLEAYFGKESLGFELSLISVHFPQKKAQVPLFKSLFEDSESLLKTNAMIIGDMNCGIPFVDSDSKTFYATKHYQELLNTGWIDNWRSRHLKAEEYTWVSARTGNRFRYDQCLSSPALDSKITSIEYDHKPREERYSDHSLMIVEFKG